MKRAKKTPVPEEKKDKRYYIYRNRNTIFSRLNREKKRLEKIKNKERFLNAKIKNKKLREELEILEKQYYDLFFTSLIISPTLYYNYF